MFESFNNVRDTCVTHSENNNSRAAGLMSCCYFPKIQIKGQEDTILSEGFGEDLVIGRGTHFLVTQVYCIIAPVPKLIHDPYTYPHISKKSHGISLHRMYFFLCKPGSIFDGLLYVFTFKVRISIQDFFKRGAVGNLPDKYGNGNSHAPYAGAAPHDIG